jgi:rubrerythrin
MHKEQIAELLYQALETEEGGVKIYETALKCAQNEDLREEWEEYLEHTREHVEIVREAMEAFGLDPSVESPGRLVVRHIGESLVEAMQMALDSGLPDAAQIVATECVVLAETKDHLNWELIGMTAEKLKGDEGKALKEAYGKVEDQEDEHLYHTAGWSRELWVDSLGMPAVLPPPEEEKDVKTAVGAARAKAARKPSKKK